MSTIYFNGNDLTPYIKIKEIIGRGISENELEYLEIPTMDGGYFRKKRKPVKPLTVTCDIRADNREEIRDKLNALNNLLSSDKPAPIEFPDEPGMTWYGMVQTTGEDKESHFIHKGSFTLLCFDPYKYAPEQSLPFTDSGMVEVGGTAPTDPVFELDILQDITHMDVIRGDGEYMRLGTPAQADENTFDRRTLILHDTCTTTTGWATPTYVDNGPITGTMGVSDGGFVADDFGADESPSVWQGPSIKKSLSEPIGNFQLDVMVENLNKSAQTGMIEIYLLDASNNTVAKIGIEDVWKSLRKIQGKMQLGNSGSENEIDYYREPDRDYGWNNYDGIIRLFRDDYSGEQRIRPYFALIYPDGTRDWVSSAYFYKDVQSNHQTPITQVQVAIRKWTGTEATSMKVKDIKVWRYNVQTGIPYMARAGDKLVIDHKKGDVLLNGESIKELKHFGASFFNLQPGYNTLYTLPEGVANTTVKWSDAYK